MLIQLTRRVTIKVHFSGHANDLKNKRFDQLIYTHYWLDQSIGAIGRTYKSLLFHCKGALHARHDSCIIQTIVQPFLLPLTVPT